MCLGAMGLIKINEQGDGLPDYCIQIVQNGSWINIMDFFTAANSLVRNDVGSVAGADASWPGPSILFQGSKIRGALPKDTEQECGWDGALCDPERGDYLFL